MKKAFTLVELLVVTLVIAILGSIVFKLKGSDNSLSKTEQRMQRLENCLSGYYAAFGTYPPVALHGSRNPFYPVNKFGFIQQVENEDPDYSTLDPERTRAACRAQPLAAEFPCQQAGQRKMKKLSDTIQLYVQEKEGYAEEFAGCAALQPFDGLETPSQLAGKKGETNWSKLQLFKFGLMSFLLPRYLLMMGHNDNSIYQQFLQWGGNNSRPCQFEDGVQYQKWSDLNQAIANANQGDTGKWLLELIPSQAVTQRWLPNLEGICFIPTGDKSFYGVSLRDPLGGGYDAKNPGNIPVYSSGDSQRGENASGTQLYVLDKVSVVDGWGNEFFYYSPPPYQSYRLWSAGPNGKTFPPWMIGEQLQQDDDLRQHIDKINAWIADDVVHMGH